MIPVKPAVSYFRDCYRLDTRTTQLDNFFGRKIELRYMLEGKEQLLNRELPYLPLPQEFAEKLSSALSLYSKEKAVYYCSLFAVGYGLSTTGKRQRLCAPVFLHEAELFQDDEGYAIRISPEKRVINVDVLSNLKVTDEDVRSMISRKVPADDFDFGKISKLQRIMSNSFTDLDVDDLLLYPTLTSEASIKKLYNQQAITEGTFKLVAAAGIGLMRRSDNTQGIMTELAEMADMDTSLPPSIMSLFGYTPPSDLPDTELGYVPATLNASQQKIIDNAHQHHLSIAIGPPGTGKSFTIASLAIEFMSRGQSVLIVSKTDQAVDVIDDKIQKDLKISNATVRAGKKDYLRELKARIENLLSGIQYANDLEHVLKSKNDLADLRVRIDACEELVKWSQEKYDSLLEHEQKWGDDLAESSGSLISRLRERYIKWLTGKKEPHWQVVEAYMHALYERVEVIRQYIDLRFDVRIKETLLKDRRTIKKLLSALRARTSSRREMLFEQLDFEALFKTLPIWLCKLSDLHQVLPFRKKLFDVVIIDEATQCDIASCLPAIYRAERVVIVGDPKQLRHVSFLSMAAQQALAKKHDLESHSEWLDFRNLSILDLVDEALDSQTQVTFLNEHYRSLPGLIRFSNRHFYNKGLRIMNIIPEDHSAANIHHVEVEGRRNKQGVNSLEANKLIGELKALIEEEAELAPSLCRSMGILSPFRDQVDHINKLLLSELPSSALDRHDILCGTAHSFQGEERDVMFLSFCLDDQGHATGFNHLNRADVFNVSVTRAKSEMRLYTSFGIAKLKADAYLRRYLDEAKEEIRKPKYQNETHDRFLLEVKEVLEGAGYRSRIGYEVADLSLDLVVDQAGKQVAIDLIGFPGAFEEGLSLRAYKVLHRAGFRTFPLPYTFWHLDPQPCKEALLQFLKNGSEA